MDYTKYSDWQINCLIAKRLNILSDMHICNERKTINRHCENGKTLKKIVQVDYCNNPSDAWPVILENKITVDPIGEAWHHNPHPQDYYYHEGICNNVSDKNPLRAAMIVFLMMNE